jgi:hypothetical protein
MNSSPACRTGGPTRAASGGFVRLIGVGRPTTILSGERVGIGLAKILCCRIREIGRPPPARVAIDKATPDAPHNLMPGPRWTSPVLQVFCETEGGRNMQRLGHLVPIDQSHELDRRIRRRLQHRFRVRAEEAISLPPDLPNNRIFRAYRYSGEKIARARTSAGICDEEDSHGNYRSCANFDNDDGVLVCAAKK